MTQRSPSAAAPAPSAPLPPPENLNQFLHRLPDDENPFAPLARAMSVVTVTRRFVLLNFDSIEAGEGLYDIEQCLAVMSDLLETAYSQFTEHTNELPPVFLTKNEA